MEKTIRTQFVKEFLEAVLTLESVDECMDFFEDICAETELRAIEQRFDVARMLSKGKIYSDIMSTTSASTATISRVSRVLNGGTGMLEKTLIRLEESEVNAESES